MQTVAAIGGTMTAWASYMAVAVGGAVGSVLRFAVHRWFERYSGASGFPWGTLTVNLVGCFAIGVVLVGRWPVRDVWRLGLTVGVLGGFTTFSTFGLESLRLWQANHASLASVYMLVSGGGGLGAVWCGERLVAWLSGPS